MNVIFFIGSVNGGGAERVVCNLANYLSSNQHNVVILTMDDSKSAYKLNDEIQHLPLLLKNERKNIFFDLLLRVARLRKYMRNNDTENSTFVVFLPITTIIMLLLKGKSKSIFVASERGNPASYPKMQQRLLKKVARRADTFVFQTKEIRDWYNSSVSDEHAAIIPNAINSEFLHRTYNGKKDKTIVAIGRLSYSKNFPLLINAFADIADSFADYKLVIYGEGPDKEKLKTQIDSMRLSERVVLAGHVDNVQEKLEKATIFVLSSKNEGMPNALIEAMALGVPCVATDCAGGGARSLICNMVNGILVERDSREKLAEGMRMLLSDNELRCTLGNNACNISDKLAPDIIYSKWEKIITEKRSRS